MPASRIPPGPASILLGLLLALPAPGDPLPARPDLDLPADGPVLEALRRRQARLGAALPSQAALRESAALAGNGLTPWDSSLLASELFSLRRGAWSWSDSASGRSIFFSPVARAGARAASGDSGGSALLTGAGMAVYGRAHPRLAYYSRALAYTEFTDRARFTHQFDPRYGETYSVEKADGDSLLENRTFNRFESYVLLDLPGVRVKAGRDRVRAGPGYFSSLMARADTPPYWLLEARIDFAPWLTVSDRLLRMTDTDHDIRKFANLHRYEFRPRPWLEVAFQDIVIYQDRDPDWSYALPLVPLTFVEANNGGRDNAAMGFDFLCARWRGFSFWGEIFLDDLVGPGTFFDDFWENRWAGLAGFQAVSPWRALDADLVVEYGRVEPWTYNGRKAQTSFRHFDVPSASKLGPDSRSVDAQISWRPASWLQLRMRAEWNDKGTARGSTLGTIHVDSIDGLKKRFLAGDVLSDRIYSAEAEARMGPWLAGRLHGRRLSGSRDGVGGGAEILARW